MRTNFCSFLLLDAFFDNEDLKVIIVASEVPFVGDDPITIQEKAAKVDFLKDHWPYNKDELVRVLDKCFNWKSQNENERKKDLKKRGRFTSFLLYYPGLSIVFETVPLLLCTFLVSLIGLKSN